MGTTTGRSAQKRESGFELLRIISMMMIVANHLVNHGILKISTEDANQLWTAGSRINRITCALLTSGGRVGVAVFFMISGFFLADRSEISVGSLWKILGRVHFYGAVMLGVFLGVCRMKQNAESYNLVRIVKQSLCIPAVLWWFALAYIVLLFLAPSINILVRSFRHRWAFPALILFIWIFFYAGPERFSYMDFIKAVLFYMMGAWVRGLDRDRKEDGKKSSVKSSVLPAVFCAIVCAGLWVLNGWLSWIILTDTTGGASGITGILLWTPNKFLNYITIPVHALFLMLLFRYIHFASDIVNRIGGCTFGVYLLHEYPHLRSFLWGDILRADTFQYASRWFPLLAAADVIAIFAAGILLETIRGKLAALLQEIIHGRDSTGSV